MVDKSVLNQAALFGIIQELGLSVTSVVDGKPVVDTSKYSYGMGVFVRITLSWVKLFSTDSVCT